MMSGRVLRSQGNDGSTHTHTPSLTYFYSLTSKATPFSMFFPLALRERNITTGILVFSPPPQVTWLVAEAYVHLSNQLQR